MAKRDELVVALAGRYALGSRADRGRMLDEFAALTGHHRKHAMRLLRAGVSSARSSPRPDRRLYNQATREALIVVWEASDRVCGKRLRPLAPILISAMERHGHLQLAPEVLAGLLTMSAATMDRALRQARGHTGGRPRRRSPPSAAIRRSVAVRTFSDWDDPPPGFMEADLVAHSGPTAKGSYVQTLTLTDIATGWTECAPVLVREQKLLTAVLNETRKLLPFPLLGFDSDNDSVFMNETVRDYCKETGVEFTRSRPYRKNDQAWVEQKNGAVVRYTVGYRRYEGLEAAAALAGLYRSLRLFVNFFQPSFKLASKSRDGAKVTKRYHPPATPHQRLVADPRTTAVTRVRVDALHATLDPVRLLSSIRNAQQQLVEIAERPVSGEMIAPTAPTLEAFLSGLRTAWREGEVRPTSRPKEKAKRGRRRPDPFVAVTAQMHAWFEAEPWRTARELLERLQDEQPEAYPARQLRTLQRRLKDWRRERRMSSCSGPRQPRLSLCRPNCTTLRNGDLGMPQDDEAVNQGALSNAARQARYRARRLATEGTPIVRIRRAVDRRSRPQRWRDAVAELLALQAEYGAWLDSLPVSLQGSATAEALQAVADFDLDALAAIELPRGYGRD